MFWLKLDYVQTILAETAEQDLISDSTWKFASARTIDTEVVVATSFAGYGSMPTIWEAWLIVADI